MNNGHKEVIEKQIEINGNLMKTCKYILATLDAVHGRLNIINKRLDRLEAFAKRSVKDE